MQCIPGVALAALLAGGCTYDLDRLRGRSDGGNDPCSVGNVIEATTGRRVGGSLIIEGTTVGGSTVFAPPNGVGCDGTYDPQTPERVIRYTVERGPRLYATTDAPGCRGAFDSVLHVRDRCDPAESTALACNDDSMVLSPCRCMGGFCGAQTSGLVLEGLSAGQTLYLVVDGFTGRSGDFVLTLTENAVPNAQASTTASFGDGVPDRCSCAGEADTMTTDLEFPASGDSASGAQAPLLSATADRIFGTRSVSFVRINGAALEATLSRNTLGMGAGCTGASAIVDVQLGDRVVHSFTVNAGTPTGTPFRVAYQTFASLIVTGGTLPVALRIRSLSVPDCGGIEFDRSAAGTLTLTGG